MPLMDGRTTRYVFFAGAACFLLLSLHVWAYAHSTPAVVLLLLAVATTFEGATNKRGMARATNRTVMILATVALLAAIAWAAAITP